MATNFYGARNNVSTTISSAYTAGSGSLVVTDGSGFLYTDGTAPSSTKPIVVSTFLADGTPKGVYRCEARSGNTITLTALLSGTDASLPANSVVEMRWCAEHVGQVATAVNTLEAGGGGGGTGTVTSVGLSMPGVIFNSTVPGSPVTTSGTLAPTLATQAANRVLAGPASGTTAASPTFRALVAADLPVITAAPGGSNTQVQFNDVGVLSGDANFTWDKTTAHLIVTGSVYCNNGFNITQINDYNTAKGAIFANQAGVDWFFTSQVASNVHIVVRAVTGQTADQIQFRKSDGTVNWALDNFNRPYTGGNAPTIAAGAGAGTSPTVSIAGTDVSGTITITTGTAPTAGATVVTVTFSAAWAAIPNFIGVIPANANAAVLATNPVTYEDQASRSTTAFVIKVTGAAGLAASTTYKYSYRVDG